MATPAAVLNIVVDANTRKAQSELKRFDKQLDRAASQRAVEAELGAKVDNKAFAVYDAKLKDARKKASDKKAFQAALGGNFDSRAFTAYSKATNRADKNTRQLGSSMGAFSGTVSRTNANVTLFQRTLQLVKIPAAITAVGFLAQAFGAAAGGATALASALAPLSGLLVAYPALAGAAGQAIGTIALALGGVGDAIGAALEGQKTAAKGAATQLSSQRAAAEGVRSATKGVETAQRSLVDAQRGVVVATEDVTDAQRDAKLAQEALTDARHAATRELVDMRLAAQGTALSEKRARLALQEARAELSKRELDPKATAAEIRDAELSVAEARLGLKESNIEAKRSQEDLNEAQRKGIAGSDQVVSAQEGVRSANRGVIDANRGLADAHRSVQQAQEAVAEAGRQVRVAQQAQAESMKQTTGGAEKLATAMSTLPAAAQDFVRFIVQLKPQLDALRATAAAGIFPGLTRGIQAAMKNFGVVQQVIGGTAKALGNLAEQAGQRFGGADWGRDIAIQGGRNIEIITRLGGALLNLTDALRHVVLAAGPLIGFLTQTIGKFAALASSEAAAARESGRLAAFFQQTENVTKRLLSIMGSLAGAFLNIGRAAAPLGREILASLDANAKLFKQWTDSAKGQNTLAKYFQSIRAPLYEAGRLLTELVKATFRLSATPGFTALLKTIRQDLLPAFEEVVASVTQAFGPVLIRALRDVLLLFGQLAGASGPLTIFVEGIALAARMMTRLLDSNPALKSMVVTLAGAAAVAKTISFFAAITGIKSLIKLAGGARAALLGVAGAQAAVGATGGAAGVAGGAAAGGGLLKGITQAFKGGAAAGGILVGLKAVFSKVKGGLGRAGLIGVGITAGAAILNGIQQQISQKGKQTLKQAFDQLGKQAGGGSVGGSIIERVFGKSDATERAERLSKALREVAKSAQGISSGRAKDLRAEINKLGGVSATAKDAFRDLVKSAETRFANMAERLRKTGTVADQFARNLRGMQISGSGSIRDLVRSTVTGSKRILEVGGSNSKKTREEISKQFSIAASRVRQAMRDKVISVKEGTKRLADLARKELGLYGISAGRVNVVLAKGPGGEMRPHQRGGPIREGKPVGDSVPALLERGEYVLNREAVKKVGVSKLDQLNFKQAARFQGGGMVRVPGDPDSTGGRDKVNSSVRALASFLVKKYNLEIGYGYDPGGGHKSAGHNVTGTAIDIVPGPGGSWDMVSDAVGWATKKGMTVYYDGSRGSTDLPPHGPGHHAHIELSAGVKGGKFPSAFDGLPRVALKGPESVALDAGQGVLDRVRQAANQAIEKVARMVGGDTSSPPAGAGDYKGRLNRNFGRGNAQTIGFNQAAMLAEKAGLPGVTYAQIAIGESGLRPGAVSPDGGFGLWQMTPRVQSPETVKKWKAIGSYFNPWNNARMAKVLAGSGTGVSNYYGTSHVTDFNKHYTGPMKGLKRGGAVGALMAAMAAGGAVRSYPLAKKGRNLGGPGAHKARAMGNWESDNAVDIGVPIGTIVKAVVAGKMGSIKGSWDGGGGQTSGIQAHLGDQWWYTHLKQIDVKSGQALEAGQRIGVSGAGNSVPHLHLAKRSGNPEMALGWPIVTAGSGGLGPGKDKPGGLTPKQIKEQEKAQEAKEKAEKKAGAPLSRKQKQMLKKLPKKPLAKHLKSVLKIVRGADKKKLRDKALAGLMKRIEGMEIPHDDKIAELQAATAAQGEFASRASDLSIGLDSQQFQNLPVDALRGIAAAHFGGMTPRQQGMIDFSGRALDGLDEDAMRSLLDIPIWGQVSGKTQVEWLELQLSTLSTLRNALIKAEAAIIKKREAVIKMIEQVQKRLAEIAEQIAEASQTRRRLEAAFKQIGELSGAKAPQRARQIVRNLKGDVPDGIWKALNEAADQAKPIPALKSEFKEQISAIGERQEGRKRERSALTKILGDESTGLIGRREALTEALDGGDGVRASLSEVQGIVSEDLRAKLLDALPEVGALGGQIFEVQMSLRDLGVKNVLPVTVPEVGETAEAAAESESAELLRELLRQANLRTAVSQLQYDVFKNFPPFGGQFHTGGVVPGPLGAERMILAQGGEVVSPAGGGDVNVRLIFPPGMDWLKDKIRVEVEHVTRSQARGAARGLSGRGGGLQR